MKIDAAFSPLFILFPADFWPHPAANDFVNDWLCLATRPMVMLKMPQSFVM